MTRRLKILSAILFGGLGAVCLWIPRFALVRDQFQTSDRILYDRSGSPLQQIRVSFQERSLPWVALTEIAPQLVKSVILAEDRRFYEHNGVDIWSIAGIGRSWLFQTDGSRAQLRGASTLSMQLVKL